MERADRAHPRGAPRRAVLSARLDAPATYAAGDPHGFGELLRGFADQVADAARVAEGLRLPDAPPGAVIVAGMGGSAIAGDFLQTLCHDRAPFPVQVVRGYDLPAWVGPDALVVVSSYSGNTEETLAACAAARARGARLLAVTAGGELGARARREGLPCVRLPGGLPPRGALGYLLIPLLVLLDRVGGGLGGVEEREEAVALLKAFGAELAPEAPSARNAAKELAAWFEGRIPVVYGTELTAPVAYRWRTQLEENAKVVALSGALPEIDHNALEAWAAMPDGPWAVLFLRDGAEHPRVARRLVATRAIAEARVPAREARARGSGRLARLLSLVHLGDWVSYYLALLRGVDPWTVATLEGFKQRMAEEDAAGERQKP